MADIRKLSRRAFLGTVGMSGAAVGGLYLTGKLTAVQNKVHFAIHGQTAAELIAARADSGQPTAVSQTWG